MDVFVKICGIANRHDLEEVVALKPNALGFILWPGSPRNVDPDELASWLRSVSTNALKVGVFVKPDLREAARLARRIGLDVVQVHGEVETHALDVEGVKVWQAVHADRMKPGEAGLRGRVDAYVADTYSKELPGGTGRTGNWEAVRGLVQTSATPVLLAGGLHPGNVREAIRAVRPWGVDVSSGVEERPGKKNVEKVREFIRLCRTW
jgi:phosphoribosylanthranilate isomerase